jgi:thiamine biosynthesis lipoprotein
MNHDEPRADIHRFEHEAMNTVFTLRLRGIDADTARGLGRECFHRVDQIEGRLSRFMEGSDIWRINRLAAAETLYLSEDCHQCLLQALDAYARTGGLFDITLGKNIEHRKSGGEGPPPAIAGSLVIHPDVPAVTCTEPGRELDLGGIGKGFALDRLRDLLADWELNDALISAGASSLLAIGGGSWPVDLTGGGPSLRIGLGGRALSVSGTGIQGAHIIHPGGEESMPSRSCTRIWTLAADAAFAEVWSTALMLVEPDEIPAIMADEPGILGVYAEIGGVIETFGR